MHLLPQFAHLLLPLCVIAGEVGCGAAAGRHVDRASNKQELLKPDQATVSKPEHLRVIAVTITAGKQVIFIKSDGTVETKIDGKTSRVARLRKTGELLHANGGLLVTLNLDGSISGAFVQSQGFDDLVIAPDGTTTQHGKLLMTISPTGEIVQDGQTVAQISGPVEGRRAAMFVFLLASAQQDGGDASSADSSATPAPSPSDESSVPGGAEGKTSNNAVRGKTSSEKSSD